MSSEELLNEGVQNAIEELRIRVKDITPSYMYGDTNMFHRFLTARNFDMDQAEAMLRKHLTWRKALQVDTILDTFQPKEFFLKYIHPSHIGCDKNGDLVDFLPAGKIDAKNIPKCTTVNHYMKHWIYYIENQIRVMLKLNEQTGRDSYQLTFIFDLDKLTLANATDKKGLETLLKFCQIMQDQYPERIKAIYIINAPSYYVIPFSIIKRILSNATVQKIHVFGYSGWKEVFMEIIDKDVLPAFLGGTRTDPDGNPLCLSFIKQSGAFPTKCYLTDEERWFKDRSQVKMLKIGPSQIRKIFVEVTECGSLIQWEFEVKNKNIGFGLFYQNSDKEVEVLPIRKLSTPDGTEKDSYITKLVGTWISSFLTTHSAGGVQRKCTTSLRWQRLSHNIYSIKRNMNIFFQSSYSKTIYKIYVV